MRVMEGDFDGLRLREGATSHHQEVGRLGDCRALNGLRWGMTSIAIGFQLSARSLALYVTPPPLATVN